MNRALTVVTLAAAALLGSAGDAGAQSGRESHWGISASFVPRWEFPEPLADIWDMEADMQGMELRVGIVRGSDRGGDVGISFVRKRVSDDSTVFVRESACVTGASGQPACARGAYHVTRDAGMTGVEAHVFMPFATIRERVQLGATFAAGVARLDGETDRFLEHLVVNNGSLTVVNEARGSGPFKEALPDLPQDWKVVPIGRVDLGISVIAAPGVKLRFTGGVNFPGYNVFGLYVHYLFQ